MEFLSGGSTSNCRQKLRWTVITDAAFAYSTAQNAFCCLVGAILKILCPWERRVFQSKLEVSSSNQCNLHHSPHTGHLEKKVKKGYNLFWTRCTAEKCQENKLWCCFSHQHVTAAHYKISYLFTYLGEFRLSVLDARTYEIYDLLTGHEIPDPIACEDHKFIFCWVNHKSPDIGQCCYHLFLGRQALRLFVCVVTCNRKIFMKKFLSWFRIIAVWSTQWCISLPCPHPWSTICTSTAAMLHLIQTQKLHIWRNYDYIKFM